MELDVRYIRDLPIPDYKDWRDNQSHNWMHPCNGPLPRIHSMLSCLGGTFCAAVWDDYNALFVFLYLEDDGPSEAAKIVGVTPRTYRWGLDDDTFRCDDAVFTAPTWKGNQDEWEKCLLTRTMIESVKLAIRTPIGMRLRPRPLRILNPAGCRGMTQRQLSSRSW